MAKRPVLQLVLLCLSLVICACRSGQIQQSSSRGMQVAPRGRTVEMAASNFESAYFPADLPTLKVVAYNAHLLPSVALPFAGERSDAKYRAPEIAKHLASYDLVCLSEVFDSASRKSLIERASRESGVSFEVAHGPGRSGRHMTGSGLLFLSKYPILETHSQTYQNASRILTHGLKADGFAAKGVLHARVQLDAQNDLELDCFLTHLDSRSASVRSQQIQELNAFVQEHRQAENPALLLGDFNVEFAEQEAGNTRSEYDSLIDSLADACGDRIVDLSRSPMHRGPVGTSDALSELGGRKIDYAFLCNPKAENTGKLKPLCCEHLPFLDPQVSEGSLSDHLAVSFELELSCSIANSGAR